jgi:PhnB protein
MQLNPYLSFDGQCEAAFKFYERCLDGKIVAMMTYGGSPMEGQTPAEWRNKIMHARLMVGDEVLMGPDAPPRRYEGRKAFR